ncbi:MAG TPA: sigma-70 family RNA polymerase sigma factor [Candidatus Avimuribaculum pullicola]|nr:sigma-70 family RNA polymerase sigma factor [Candidatus Avimuribaculum pullicola]
MKDAIKWSDIVEGREEAFTMLYDLYSDLLYGYGMKIVPDEDVVMDAIQSLYMNIFEKRKHLSVPTSIAAYLCRSLKNILINELQSASVRNTRQLDETLKSDYDFDLELDAEGAMIAGENERERFDIFQAELGKLSHQQREMLYLRYYKGLEIGEIAEILAVSKRTVYNTTNNALTRLRENPVLARYFGEAALLYLLTIGKLYII